jgi:hypothetical protein
MTFEELIAAVRAQMGTPTTDDFYTDAILGTFVNSAVQYVSLLADWYWLLTSEEITTESGTANYDYADDLLKSKSIVEIGKPQLEWRHQDSILSSRPSVGVPRYFFLGADILLYPTPNSEIVYTHNYYKQEPVLEADDDEPLLPVPFQSLIVHYAAKLAWDRGQRDSDSQRELQNFTLYLKQVLKRAKPSSGPYTPRSV